MLGGGGEGEGGEVMDIGEGMCYGECAAKCVNLAIHGPVPLGLIIHYVLKKKDIDESIITVILQLETSTVSKMDIKSVWT